MVNSCVAIDYTNHYKAGSGICHNFSHNKPELLQKWTQAVRRKTLETKQTYFYLLCIF